MSREEKDHSYHRIVASASGLLRERGVADTSVGDVMRDAGLTHGGFYRHFETKEALLDAALAAAFEDIVQRFGSGDEPLGADAFQAFYLSKKHVAHPALGCPATALAGEVARASPDTKRIFGAGIRRMIAALADGATAANQGKAAATRRLAMMVGAVALARASDPATAEAVLAACRAAPND